MTTRQDEEGTPQGETTADQPSAPRHLTPAWGLVVAAAVTGAAGLSLAWYNANETRALERLRAEDSRILQVLQAKSNDQAADNLQFLVATGLVRDRETKTHIEKYLSTRAPGGGPLLIGSSQDDMGVTGSIQNAPRWKPVFQENFKQDLALSGWIVPAEGVSLVALEAGKSCTQISRQDPSGETYITRDFPGPGSYRFEARIRSERVSGGGKKWLAGQFNAAILEGDREVGWPKDDFEDTSDFAMKVFQTPPLTSNQVARLRVGIQDGVGIICVSDLTVFAFTR